MAFKKTKYDINIETVKLNNTFSKEETTQNLINNLKSKIKEAEIKHKENEIKQVDKIIIEKLNKKCNTKFTIDSDVKIVSKYIIDNNLEVMMVGTTYDNGDLKDFGIEIFDKKD